MSLSDHLLRVVPFQEDPSIHLRYAPAVPRRLRRPASAQRTTLKERGRPEDLRHLNLAEDVVQYTLSRALET